MTTERNEVSYRLYSQSKNSDTGKIREKGSLQISLRTMYISSYLESMVTLKSKNGPENLLC